MMTKQTEDFFEQYFAEKLWEMIPYIYKQEDSIAKPPGILRALVEIIAGQAALLRRSHDSLWNDQFIDLCSDWAVPYIADLLNTRLVSATILRGRRIDVAKTIYYRRRKGTLRVLEELVSDITEWEGKVVENFRRLGRTHHNLDPYPEFKAGLFSRTLPGGWADLRNQSSTELTGTAFDEFHYTVDMRRHRGVFGRYGIRKLAFHLFRLRAFKVSEAEPWSDTNGKKYTFDPSGRDIPLFMPRNRSDENWDNWLSTYEWELPAPIRCRLLGHEEKNSTSDIYGKKALIPDALWVNAGIQEDEIVSGNLVNWSANVLGKRLVIDPERGRFLFVSNPPAGKILVSYYYGFSGKIGAGTYEREVEKSDPGVAGGGELKATEINDDGITQIDDSRTYSPINSKTGIKNLTIQAANYQRPYLYLTSNWELDTGTNSNCNLILNGLWIGGKAGSEIILKGDYKKVRIQHTTFDPGGKNAKGDPIEPIKLVIAGHVDLLEITSSITGPIETEPDSEKIENLVIEDSIVQSIDRNVSVLSTWKGNIHLNRVTILGKIDVHRLWASETLISGGASVKDTQNGCFRFSSAPDGSRLPKPYESYFFRESNHFFTSQNFGDPGYAQLSKSSPEALKRGAENFSEIGAFNSLINPIKLDSLRIKVEEYMPFGLIPIFIQET